MDEVESLLQMNYATVIIGLFIILFAAKEIVEVVSYFKKKFGIKTVVDEKEEERQAEIDRLKKHDDWQYEKINEICCNIEDLKAMIKDGNERQKHATVATCRSTLYRLHKDLMSQGYVTKEGLKTFLEIGKVYEDCGGDDIYHEKLYPEVMSLPIND